MTIGSDLQSAREQRGMTLRDISDRTKIRVPVLRAIESNDFAHAPGGVIMRGFLKLYAREVGLDPDDIARRFAEVQSSDAEQPSGEVAAAIVAAAPKPRSTSASRIPTALIAVVAVAGIVVAGGLVWKNAAGRRGDTAAAARASVPAAAAPAANSAASAARPAETASPEAAPPAAAAAPPAATPAAAATSGSVAPPAPPAKAGSGLRVDVRATAACWLAATADGAQVAYRVLNPGDHVSLSVTSEAVLRIGMPGNVSVSINDAPVKPFARPGTPTTLRITPANYRDLLAP